ncbi:hypothetical protein K3495_g1123 [Podosphaera aphanis]|nr:hypothetical protein K3495_g1123 [Podosphaera aphanis]
MKAKQVGGTGGPKRAMGCSQIKFVPCGMGPDGVSSRRSVAPAEPNTARPPAARPPGDKVSRPGIGLELAHHPTRRRSGLRILQRHHPPTSTMQSIAPAPGPQSRQDPARQSPPLRMKRAAAVQHFREDVSADTAAPTPEMAVDNDLRAQLAAVMSTGPHHSHPLPHPHPPPPHPYPEAPTATTTAHEGNIDPAIGGSSAGRGSMMLGAGGESGGDDGNDGRKSAKRELSQSKRAAQNRAAQRAFRQRKEGYIKKLEEQVRELHNLNESLKASQAENYTLREYIIHLQSRLIESHGEFPQPPPNINLAHPHTRLEHHAPVAPMNALQTSTAARNLAVASMGPKQEAYEPSKRFKEDTTDDEEGIRSHLQVGNVVMSGPI